jgi:hypothetical protein
MLEGSILYSELGYYVEKKQVSILSGYWQVGHLCSEGRAACGHPDATYRQLHAMLPRDEEEYRGCSGKKLPATLAQYGTMRARYGMGMLRKSYVGAESCANPPSSLRLT